MAIADSSGTTLYYIDEVTPGVTPATPAFTQLRLTGESLSEAQATVTSEEMTPTVDVPDETVTSRSATGDVNFELSYSSYDTILAHALRGAWASNVLKTGTLRPAVTLEKRFEMGATDRFFRYLGMRVSDFSLTVPARDRVTGTFSFRGNEENLATGIIAGATYNAAPQTRIMLANDVANIALSTVSNALHYTNFNMRLANNLRDQPEIGTGENYGVGFGRRDITGGLTAYFESEEMYQLYKNGDFVSFEFDISDGTDTYNFLFPRLKFTSGRVVAGGNNQDVVAEMGWRAFYDQTAECSLQITR